MAGPRDAGRPDTDVFAPRHSIMFRDESMHITFAAVAGTVRREESGLFDDELTAQVSGMLAEAVEAELAFCPRPVWGRATRDEHHRHAPLSGVRRRPAVGLARPTARYGSTNPFMQLQDVQELTNFFERRVSAYQIAVSGSVSLDEVFETSPGCWRHG